MRADDLAAQRANREVSGRDWLGEDPHDPAKPLSEDDWSELSTRTANLLKALGFKCWGEIAALDRVIYNAIPMVSKAMVQEIEEVLRRRGLFIGMNAKALKPPRHHTHKIRLLVYADRLEGMTRAEIAAKWGIKPSAVDYACHRIAQRRKWAERRALKSIERKGRRSHDER